MYYLKGYVRLVPQGVAPFHLGSGLLTSGKVTRAPELPTSILDFLFYWSGVLVSKAGIRFLVVMLSCPRLLCSKSAIVAPCLFCWDRVVCLQLLGLGPGLFAIQMRFPVLLITTPLHIIHTYDMSKFDRILQTLI